MKVGDTVKVKTGKKGRPPVGIITEISEDGQSIQITRKGVLERYGAHELESKP